MRTPAGTECPFFYADFHRGHHRQECRLVESTPDGGRWTPDLCRRCRVPSIVRANACPHLILEGRVVSGPLGLGRKLEVTATCTRSLGPVAEPEVGCGLCHTGPPLGPETPERP